MFPCHLDGFRCRMHLASGCDGCSTAWHMRHLKMFGQYLRPCGLQPRGHLWISALAARDDHVHLWKRCNKYSINHHYDSLNILESVIARPCNPTVSANQGAKRLETLLRCLTAESCWLRLSYWWHLVVTMVTVDACSNMFKQLILVTSVLRSEYVRVKAS